MQTEQCNMQLVQTESKWECQTESKKNKEREGEWEQLQLLGNHFPYSLSSRNFSSVFGVAESIKRLSYAKVFALFRSVGFRFLVRLLYSVSLFLSAFRLVYLCMYLFYIFAI